jgi:tRNA 2-selenouridine synthase
VDAWSSASRRRSGGTQFVVLAGLAGAGKTELLRTLPSAIDLEALASHRGSTFGGIGMPPQPTQADFDTAVRSGLLHDGRVVVEDEGTFVGSLTVPPEVCRAIETTPVVEVVAPFDARVARLTREYGPLDRRSLIRATQRIRARLGGPVADRAISHFAAGRSEAAIAALLPYFDAAYRHRWARLDRPVAERVLASCSR